MVDLPRDNSDASEPECPQTLARDLRSLFAGEPSVPSHVDDTVLAAARSHFARQRRHRLLLRLASASAAAAAAIVLLMLYLPAGQVDQQRVPSQELAAIPEDVDRNGRVDILDAFALARRIEASDVAGLTWDINGDGHVDGTDVDAVALRAVRINGG